MLFGVSTLQNACFRLLLAAALVCVQIHAQSPSGTDGSQRALALERAGQYPDAEQAWLAVLGSSPDDVEANAHLGLVYALQGKYAQAVPAYQRALALRPGLPGVNLDLGLALFKEAHLTEAIAPLEEASKETPPDPRAGLLLGMAYYGTAQYASAVPFLRAGVDQAPTNVDLRLALAQSCLWSSQYDCALEQYSMILKQDPNSAQADMIAGQALDAKGDTPGAIVQFRAAEAAAPNMPDLHFGLGYLLWKQSKYADAAPEFQQELKLEPNHGQALTYLGDIALKNNQWEEGRNDLQLAIAQTGAIRLAFLDMAIVDEHDKHFQQAVDGFKHAIDMAPGNPDAHWRLARLLQSMGEKEQADSELARVRQLHQSADDKNAQLMQQMGQPHPLGQP